MKALLLLLTLISFSALAADGEKPLIVIDEELSNKLSNYQIDSRYKAGEYLIYQCEFEYYACVDADANQKCLEKREEEKTKKHKSYTCAPLKKFQNKKACLVSNYEVVESNAKKRFCYPE